jgi:hypothetical protein
MTKSLLYDHAPLSQSAVHLHKPHKHDQLEIEHIDIDVGISQEHQTWKKAITDVNDY